MPKNLLPNNLLFNLQMAKSHCNTQNAVEVENYTEMEDSDDQDFVSDDSEEDPTYFDDLEKAQSKFSNLSIKTKPKSSSRIYAEIEIDDDVSAPKLGIEDIKNLEEVQRMIDCGQVEKLKVEQCKVYLRKHRLRLTGKKDILIQRIKEHLEISNGGGEKMFPASSFELNCKGDACMGDIVMFEQTVYEGYNILSRSAIGAPCGKRIVAGRIVNESYGAAKQQHTFTVEVLWSKGDKPLPPLHPLLIKGRNLYKLNTLRQRWEDELERQRVLSEKHSRGSIARSNREVRIQEKITKKMLKGTRVHSKEGLKSHQEKNRSTTNHVSIHDSQNQGSKALKQHTVTKKAQKQQTNQEHNLKVSAEFKENSNVGLPITQPPLQNMSTHQVQPSRVCLSYKDQNSTQSNIGPPKFQKSGLACSSLGSHCTFPDKYQQTRQHQRQQHHLERKENSALPVLHQVQSSQVCLPYKDQNSTQSHIGPPNFQQSRPACSSLGSQYTFPDKYQQTRQHPRQQHYLEHKENSALPVLHPHSFQPNISNTSTYHFFNQKPQHESCNANHVSSRTSSQNFYGRNHHREKQQPCRYYPQGKCYYGDRCKFLHE